MHGRQLSGPQIRHVRSTEHDLAVLNRVIGRIESLPNFDPDKTYNLVQLDRTKFLPPRYPLGLAL